MFSGALGLVESPRRFDEMSLRRFAAWGTAVGFLLSALAVLTIALAGDVAFLSNLVVVGPIVAAAAAGSAAGSLTLARRAQRWRRLLVQLGAAVPNDAWRRARVALKARRRRG